MTEHQLIEKCILGDRSAQHLLYERYCKAMYTTAHHQILLNDEAASEMC